MRAFRFSGLPHGKQRQRAAERQKRLGRSAAFDRDVLRHAHAVVW